jgi:hypothetical protein
VAATIAALPGEMTAIEIRVGEFGARIGSVEHLRPIVAGLERRLTTIREHRSDGGASSTR